jgi:hypothetical protein
MYSFSAFAFKSYSVNMTQKTYLGQKVNKVNMGTKKPTMH